MMTMMEIRPVGMFMTEGRVLMPMGMSQGGRCFRMRVIVMAIVMPMPMLVAHGLVLMEMSMTLHKERQQRSQENDARDPLGERQCFS